MAAELKEQFFNRKVYRRMADLLREVYPAFEADAFYRKAVRGLNELELNDRMRRTAALFREYLPADFGEAVAILKIFAPKLTGYSGICVPEYIGRYGSEDPKRFDAAMRALRDVTEYSSSEFAVRLFLQRDFPRAFKYMLRWSRDKNYHVRRLASEGLRPRLPWSGQLKNLIEDPRPAFPVLEELRADSELYVRKSVANHLNDVAKDHPDLMLDLIEAWDAGDERTAWIQKQACRALIKAGHARTLDFFGFGGKPQLKRAAQLSLSRKTLRIGEDFEFALAIEGDPQADEQQLVLDYRVHYRKQDGSSSGKVFKLTTIALASGATFECGKKHSFVERTTRRHYPGEHRLEILANGEAIAEVSFQLKAASGGRARKK
ncbi:MAG: DNA alkylation repair protein [bacterium]|nr:DNA alkylation repair protein [bacterium]